MKSKLEALKFHGFIAMLILFGSSLMISTVVAGECTCVAEDLEEDPKSTTVEYRAASIFAILLASTAGILIPVLGANCTNLPVLRPETGGFFMVKSFAAGVIVATAFIHILPDAFENLTSPCLKGEIWENFPFAGFIAMLGALGTLMIDSTATAYYRRAHKIRSSSIKAEELQDGDAHKIRSSSIKAEELDDGDAHKIRNSSIKAEELDDGDRDGDGHLQIDDHESMHIHAHSHARTETTSPPLKEGENWTARLNLIRHRVTSQVLELGIMVHSIIIGITLGVSGSIATIKTLMVALCFHQFFEGMGLGGCISQANFKTRATTTMVLLFAITAPLGVAIGIGISNVYSESSPTSLIVQGVLDSAAAGVLIYMALVDLLAADFMHEKVQDNPMLQFGCSTFLLLGAGFMSLLAKWA